MASAAIFGCTTNSDESDAYGNFEAVEIKVSALAPGTLLYLNVEEGKRVTEGELLGLIDTTNFYLKKEQLKASYAAALSRRPAIAAQAATLEEQKKNALRELNRFQTLSEKGAAAAKQADDLHYQVNVLEKQIASVKTQDIQLTNELKVIQAQIAQVERQIEECKIIAPVSGTVLVKLAEPRELVAIGSPLFRIANLDTLTLKVYVSGTQLDDIRLGQRVSVLIDKDKKRLTSLPGVVTWIASEAEFTPKNIQTRESRTDLVYAVKLKTPNPGGILKIGMPGEAIFSDMNNQL